MRGLIRVGEFFYQAVWWVTVFFSTLAILRIRPFWLWVVFFVMMYIVWFAGYRLIEREFR